jgi:ABC-type nickel/cobalt efflux system permease component RcnA
MCVVHRLCSQLLRAAALGAALWLATAAALPAQGPAAREPGNTFGPRPETAQRPAPPTQPPAAPGAGNYFGPRAAAPQSAAQPELGAAGGAAPAAPSIFRAPRWVRVLLTRIAEAQRRINAALTVEVRRLRTPEFWAAAGTLFGLSFLYGVFHAAGPGHGKVITTAYLATRNARFRHAVLMCGANALAQSLTAILLVGAFAVVVDLGSEWILGKSIWLEQLSYGLIALVGAVMLFNAVTGREHRHGGGQAHEHAPQPATQPDSGHGHGHAAHSRPGAPSLGELLSTAVAVGIRPCSGAILVLLFTLANGVFWIGVLATLLMGVGVAATLSLMGAVTVGARVAATSFIAEDSRLARVGARVMHIGAGCLLVAMGLLLLWASTLQGSLGG